MKLVTYTAAGAAAHIGADTSSGIVDLSSIAPTMRAFIDQGAAALEAARAVLASPVIVEGAKLSAPLAPGKVLCCGINYKGHADENPNAKMPDEPFFFAKLPSSIIGPNDAIRVPSRSSQVDYEVEFAIVIGRRLSRAAEAEVMPAVFGYTLLNDVSARDVQFKDAQITLGKNFEGFAPIGPCIVTADELSTPWKVRLRTRLNGETMQDGSTDEWIFPIPRLLSFLSQVMPLEPGDVVTTGTPAGIGYFRKPQVFMKAGDVVEIEAEGIGILRNQLVS